MSVCPRRRPATPVVLARLAFAALGGFAIVTGAALLAPRPAAAEIEKFIRACGSQNGAIKLCPSFRASTPVPEGWVEDKAASREFDAQMLLPKGQNFDGAPAKLYVSVRFNPKKQPVDDFLPQALQDWRDAAKDGTITTLPDQTRAPGKPPYKRLAFAAPSLKEQGFETTAVTSDGDKDGNLYVVTIVLTADTRAAFDAAMPAFQAILAGY